MKDSFNDKIRDAFGTLEDDINPEIIWSGINVKVGKSKNKKRRFLVWWIFGIGICSILIFVLNNTGETTKLNVEKIVSNRANDQFSGYSDPEIKEHNPSIINTQKRAASEEIPPTSMNGIGDELENQDRLFSQDREIKIADTKRKVINGSILDKEDRDTESMQYSISKEKTKLLSTKSVSNTIAKLDLLSTSNKNDTRKLAVYQRNVLTHIPELKIIKAIPIQYNRLQEVPLSMTLVKAKKYDQSKGLTIYNSIELYSGISVGSKTIISSSSNYDMVRNESERLLEQLHLGARSRLARYRGFEFYIGLRYSRINDSWKMNFEYTKDLPYSYIDYQTELPDGNIEDHFTTDTLTHIHKRYIEQYNTEQLMTIPLEIRYGKKMADWTISAGIGIEISYLFASNQRVIGLDGLPSVESKEGQWLSPRISTGIYTSYALNSEWSIAGNLNYRSLSLQSNTILSGLTSNYKLFGIELGVVRNL